MLLSVVPCDHSVRLIYPDGEHHEIDSHDLCNKSTDTANILAHWLRDHVEYVCGCKCPAEPKAKKS